MSGLASNARAASRSSSVSFGGRPSVLARAFPEFDSLDAVNELLRILVMGLWNRLSRHQERSAPFRLVRVEIPETREGLARIALIRREELDGFVEGLFGKEQSLELPERAHRACVNGT